MIFFLCVDGAICNESIANVCFERVIWSLVNKTFIKIIIYYQEKRNTHYLLFRLHWVRREGKLQFWKILKRFFFPRRSHKISNVICYLLEWITQLESINLDYSIVKSNERN